MGKITIDLELDVQIDTSILDKYFEQYKAVEFTVDRVLAEGEPINGFKTYKLTKNMTLILKLVKK